MEIGENFKLIVIFNKLPFMARGSWVQFNVFIDHLCSL